MGKEWLYWGGGARATKRGRGEERETPSGCMNAVIQLFDFHHFQFALHQQPSFKPDSSLPEEPTILKGVEAPRNSLELEEPIMGAISLSSTMKEEENLNIPMMGIQIKTSTGSSITRSSKARTDDLSSECSSSPGVKTPNLVARLMGLDLLPDNCSPSLLSSNHSISAPLSKSHQHAGVHHLKQEFQSRQLLQSRSSSNRNLLDTDIIGTRSLPETPRISSARRSDVDHRLSLQINKENIGVSGELEFSSYSTSRTVRRRELRQEVENRSPSHYARQIVKQVKESVSRKVGLDITNTIKNREQGRDERVVLLKSKKPSKVLTKLGDESSPGKQSTPSCSPRLRFLDPKNKLVTTPPVIQNQNSHSPKLSSSPLSSISADTQSQSSKVSSKPKTDQPLHEHQQQQQQNSIQKCKDARSERFTPRLKKPLQTSNTIRNKQDESFVRSSTTNRANLSDKKSKKTPLSNDLLHTNVPTLLSVKKDPTPPATKLPQKQSEVSDSLSLKGSTQLSSCLSHSYKQQATHMRTVQDNSDDDRSNSVTTTGGGEEFEYITRILKRTGIDRNTPVSFTKWYSPSHPLDPSIFHRLELSFPTTTITNSQLSQPCNRKLMFQLVDEVLAQLLKPLINLKPWVTSITHNDQMCGSQLIDTLCAKIRSFPSSDCRVLEDIHALIEKDLCKTKSQRSIAFEEEGEAIVSEIEREIVDSLVHETAVVVFGVACPYRKGG